jgi:hypothetical protein
MLHSPIFDLVSKICLLNSIVPQPADCGVFATIVTSTMDFVPHPCPADRWTFAAGLVLTTLVGLLGIVLHVNANLTSQGVVIIERFLRGAPILGPLFFSYLGLFGFLVSQED